MALMFQKLPDRAQKLNTSLIKAFEAGVDEAFLGVSEVRQIVFDATSEGVDGVDAIYLFPTERRGLRRRGADRSLVPDRPQVYESVVANEDAYLLLDVDLNDYKDDKIKKYDEIAYEWGTAAATGPVIDIEELIEDADGSNALCYDGTPMFSVNSHPVDPLKKSAGTWGNKLVRAAGLTFDTFSEARTAMLQFPSNTPGKAAGSRPSHLLYSPEFEGIAMDITKNERPSQLQGGGNPWIGERIVPVCVPNWKDRSLWMLADARSSRKRPFVFQEREQIQLVPNGIDPEDPAIWERGYLRWIVKGRYGVGYGYPTKALLVTKS